MMRWKAAQNLVIVYYMVTEIAWKMHVWILNVGGGRPGGGRRGGGI